MKRGGAALVLAAGLLQAPGAHAQPAGGMERAERLAGRFTLAGRDYTVKLAVAHPPGESSPEAVESIEIADVEGTVHWRRVLASRAAAGRFEEYVEVDVRPILGKRGQGLLVTYRAKPETPGASRSWQVFGAVENRLRPLSKPITLEGDLAGYAAGPDLKAAYDEALRLDVLDFRVWTGRFFVVVPVALHWEWGAAGLAYPLSRCRLDIVCERSPRAEVGSVALFEKANEDAETAGTAVRRESAVEFLWAEGAPQWEDEGEQVALGASADVWLRVRIDGKEGWLHSEEDFDAVGLPEKDQPAPSDHIGEALAEFVEPGVAEDEHGRGDKPKLAEGH